MLEMYVCAIPDLNVSLDGFKILQVVRETESEIRVVGLSYLLPDAEVPMELELKKELEFTSYFLRFGKTDIHWESQTESKRWKSVYMYATESGDLTWNWQNSISGKLLTNCSDANNKLAVQEDTDRRG